MRGFVQRMITRTPSALDEQVSTREQVRFKYTPIAVRAARWIPNITRERVPGHRASNRERPTAVSVLSVVNQRLYLLSQFKAQGLPSDSLQIIFHALILSQVEYALPEIAGLLSETDKSIGRCFYKGKTTWSLCHSDFFVSQLIDRADRKLFKLIQLSHHYLNPLLPSSRLPYSTYSLRSRRHQFSLPQLDTALYRNVLSDRYLFQYV